MAITSTNINDLVALTSVLEISSGSVIENVTYTHSTRSMTFAAQPAFSLSAADFLSFSTILNNFNTNVFYVFNVNVNGFATFEISKVLDVNDGVSTLTFDFRKGVRPIYLITATYPSGNLSFAQRTISPTLTYEEWVYFQQAKFHYEQEIRKVFNI